MNHSWTMEEMVVILHDDGTTVKDVQCSYCRASLPWSMPSYSNNPDDVTVSPAHECPSLPPEIEET